jgi:uncharacterized ParB-like nuclease family protein
MSKWKFIASFKRSVNITVHELRTPVPPMLEMEKIIEFSLELEIGKSSPSKDMINSLDD